MLLLGPSSDLPPPSTLSCPLLLHHWCQKYKFSGKAHEALVMCPLCASPGSPPKPQVCVATCPHLCSFVSATPTGACPSGDAQAPSTPVLSHLSHDPTQSNLLLSSHELKGLFCNPCLPHSVSFPGSSFLKAQATS